MPDPVDVFGELRGFTLPPGQLDGDHTEQQQDGEQPRIVRTQRRDRERGAEGEQLARHRGQDERHQPSWQSPERPASRRQGASIPRRSPLRNVTYRYRAVLLYRRLSSTPTPRHRTVTPIRTPRFAIPRTTLPPEWFAEL